MHGDNMERAIVITFDQTTGNTKIETEGFEGISCLLATQPFEEALGIISDRQFKPEAEQQQIHTNVIQQRLRQ